jgi:hypothetical protein
MHSPPQASRLFEYSVGGDLSTDSERSQADSRLRLFTTDFLVCCPLIGWATTVPHKRVLCYQVRRREFERFEPNGSPANWPCMKLEKFIRIELLDGIWYTAPNHSRLPLS